MNWFLLSHIAANYTEVLTVLTRITTGTWSEQHHVIQGSWQKGNTCHSRNFIDFFDIHGPFPMSGDINIATFINIATGVVPSGDVNKDTSFKIGLKKLSELDDKKLGEVLQL